MRLRHQLFGKRFGDFSFGRYYVDAFLRLLRPIFRETEVLNIYLARCESTTRIVKADQEGNFESLNRNIRRSRKPADGVIISGPGQGVAIFNADCPVVAVLDASSGRLGVVHAAFRCLVPLEEESQSILNVLFRAYHFSPRDAEVFIGYGIGPCCYGAKHIPEVQRLEPLPISWATKGPRKGQPSIDLYRLIQSQLAGLGIGAEQIAFDKTCTACSPDYHSNCRDGAKAGRNAAVCWLE